MIPMGDWGLDRAPNYWFLFFSSFIMAFICQDDKSSLRNIHFSQISQVSKIQKFWQNPKRINKKSTLIIVFAVCLCSPTSIWDMSSKKMCHFFEFSCFYLMNSLVFLQNQIIWERNIFTYLILYLELLDIQSCTIPHFSSWKITSWPVALHFVPRC